MVKIKPLYYRYWNLDYQTLKFETFYIGVGDCILLGTGNATNLFLQYSKSSFTNKKKLLHL